MPLQNRVTPWGNIVAAPERGTMYGNRGGCFHRPDQTLRPRQYASNQWICCLLHFKGRRRRLMQPGLFTELFFLDEATALAAGHRPCFECRRRDAIHYAELWNAAQGHSGRAAAPTMDQRLQPERIHADGRKITFQADLASVPDGTMFWRNGQAELVFGPNTYAWSLAGYGPPSQRPRVGMVNVLTPRSTLVVLAQGYQAQIHASAIRPTDTERER